MKKEAVLKHSKPFTRNCLPEILKLRKSSALLSPSIVTEVIEELKLDFRSRIFTPFVTLYAFIFQVLEDDSSCRRAVAKVMILRLTMCNRSCSASTASYCRSRAKLPKEFFTKVSSKLYKNLSSFSNQWSWKHGEVKVVDGSSFSVADTKMNLKEYSRQKKGKKNSAESSYPKGRILGVFCLATGGLIDLKISGWKGKGTGELSLMRKVWSCFKKGDTLLADSLFSSFFVIEHAVSLGVQVVVELPAKKAKNLKKKLQDQVLHLKKTRRPDWISHDEYQSLQDEIKVRVIKLVCAPKGFRPKTKWILTTHSKEVTAEDIKALYNQRWHIELNFRSLKSVLGMDHIPVKTPDMVEKHIWVHMIAYNILRIRMAEAAKVGDCSPTQLSFRATQQITAEMNRASQGNFSIDYVTICFILQNTVGQRPGRYEPRASKQRLKRFSLLREPRESARLRLHKKYKSKKTIS